MKLNVRFILIAFLVVLIVSISSMFIFYSLAGSLINSSSQKLFVMLLTILFFLYRINCNIDEDLRNINRIWIILINSTGFYIDWFCFHISQRFSHYNREFKVKTNSVLNIHNLSFKKFFVDNPNLILKYSQLSNGKNYLLWSLISTKFLDIYRKKIPSWESADNLIVDLM